LSRDRIVEIAPSDLNVIGYYTNGYLNMLEDGKFRSALDPMASNMRAYARAQCGLHKFDKRLQLMNAINYPC
jgi:hypothetical protein